MSRLVRIALGQEADGWPNDASPDAIREHHHGQMEPLIAQAGAAKADIICFSENAFGHGIENTGQNRDDYQDVLDGPDMRWAAEQAARQEINIIMPTVGFHAGQFRNVSIVLDRKGNLAGVYEKVHLTNWEKKSGLVGGDAWPVFDLDFGRVGIMICHDLHFPESARCLALNGAEIIFWPTHFQALWGDDYIMALMRATAIHNGVYLASISLGPEPGQPWVSNAPLARSGLIGPRGEWRFSAGFQPGLAMGTIDLDERLDRPWFSDSANDDYRERFRADRRPDTYGRLMEP